MSGANVRFLVKEIAAVSTWISPPGFVSKKTKFATNGIIPKKICLRLGNK
jgi:hypothetical protein